MKQFVAKNAWWLILLSVFGVGYLLYLQFSEKDTTTETPKA
jgi:threonine/homoserine/homoserine lactone efflux protein